MPSWTKKLKGVQKYPRKKSMTDERWKLKNANKYFNRLYRSNHLGHSDPLEIKKRTTSNKVRITQTVCWKALSAKDSNSFKIKSSNLIIIWEYLVTVGQRLQQLQRRPLVGALSFEILGLDNKWFNNSYCYFAGEDYKQWVTWAQKLTCQNAPHVNKRSSAATDENLSRQQRRLNITSSSHIKFVQLKCALILNTLVKNSSYN